MFIVFRKHFFSKGKSFEIMYSVAFTWNVKKEKMISSQGAKT